MRRIQNGQSSSVRAATTTSNLRSQRQLGQMPDTSQFLLAKGQNLWIRFSPPSMCYSVDDETEMLSVIQQVLAETALFAVVMRGDEWVERP